MFKFKRRRRPVWQPSMISRLGGFVKNVLKHLTFKRVVVAVFVLPLFFYIYREVSHDALIIEPFSVPKRFEESGLTPEVVSNRIGEALRQIETDANTRIKKDNLMSLRDEGAMPDVDIPGTKLGLKTLVEITREILGIHLKHIGGDIVILASGEPSASEQQLRVTVYITQGRERSQAASLVLNTDDIDKLAQATAEAVLQQVNPYMLAKYRYEHHELEKAEIIVQGIVRDQSADRAHVAAAFNLWGIMRSDVRKYDEAIAKYKKAIEQNPKFALAYSNWGNVLDRQGKYDEAIGEYAEAVKIDSKYASAYYGWGRVFVEQRRYDAAAVKLNQAIELDPNSAVYYDGLARVLQLQHKNDEAIAKYAKAVELDPKDAFAYTSWGDVLYEQKKYDEAIAKYEKAVEVYPKDAISYYDWGIALYEQKKYDEAIAKYEKAIELDPKSADYYDSLGRVLQLQQRNDEAAAKYAKAVELDPRDVFAYSNWGNVLNEQNKYGKAITKFEKAIEINQKAPDVYHSWGWYKENMMTGCRN